MPVLCAVLLLLVAASHTLAQRVELSSPLDGYVRPGRAVAVHVSAGEVPGQTLTISGDGVVPVQIPTTAGRVEADVPLLAQGQPPAELRWTDGTSAGVARLPTRLLATDERLVALAGDVPDATALASDLFPGHTPVLVKLETDRPRLLFPAQAFDAADAVLLDLTAAARVDESQLRVLLAAGTAVAIRSPARPQGDWPWRQQGNWWVLRHEPAGPPGGVNMDAYLPTYAWDRSWPAEQRRAVLLSAALAAMLLVGASLWRGRWGLVAALVVCTAAVAGSAFYAAGLRPAATAGGEITLWDGQLAQRDRWTYVSAFRDTALSVPADGRTRPVLGSKRQLKALNLRLATAPSGLPERFHFDLGAKQTIAMVSRSVSPQPPPDTSMPVDVPMELIADQLYPGTAVGQTKAEPQDAPGQWWGTVVLRR